MWAAGNGGSDGYSSSIYTIAVGSADQNGGPADYDEECAAKMVSYTSETFPDADDTWDPYKQIVSSYSQCGSFHIATMTLSMRLVMTTGCLCQYTTGVRIQLAPGP